MKPIFYIIFVFLVVFNLISGNVAAQNTYKNPIITADYSDPDVIRVGNDYYMTASSFNIVPGLPVLHSKDLVNWKIIGHGVQELPDALFTYRNRKADELDYDLPRLGKGVYAPCIRYHDDFFWIFWGDPDAGVYMVKSRKPEGPWSKPHLVKKAHGWIDTTPLWDEETGKAWLAHAYAHSRAGINSKVAVAEMSWDGKELLSDDVIVFDANDHEKYPADRKHSVIEGCKFMKRNGFYYIHCPAGGVPTGWQTTMRAEDPLGPYEIRVVCERGETNVNGPHQGGLVDTPSGEWWFANFQSVNVLGRIVWLQPAKWEDNWPVIGEDKNKDGIGNPVMEYRMPNTGYKGEKFSIQSSDEFNKREIGLQWQWPANTGKTYCSAKKGNLVVKPFVSKAMTLIDAPNVATQMFPAFEFSTTTKVALKGGKSETLRGGLAVMGRKCFDIGIEKNKEATSLSLRYGDKEEERILLTSNEVILKLDAKGELPLPLKFKGEENRGRVKCQFSYSTDGKEFKTIGRPFDAREGTWIGARIGLYCLSDQKSKGSLNVDWYRVETHDHASQLE